MSEAGGIGGAKLALDRKIWPDFDTLAYMLAGQANREPSLGMRRRKLGISRNARRIGWPRLVPSGRSRSGAGVSAIDDRAGTLNGPLEAALRLRILLEANIAILDADLPWLWTDIRRNEIAPDQHGQETSALVWRGGKMSRLGFRSGSLHAHRAIADAAGMQCPIIARNPAFHSNDMAVDLALPQTMPPCGIAA